MEGGLFLGITIKGIVFFEFLMMGSSISVILFEKYNENIYID